MAKKLVSLDLLLKKISLARPGGATIGFTNGCFDILHAGHVDYLEKAKSKSGLLIVGLNSDKSVKKIKGNSRPINSQNARAKVLSALEAVDFIVVFGEQTPYRIIKAIKPDFIFKGRDWKNKKVVGSDIVKKYGGRVILLPYLKGYSTTEIFKKTCKESCSA
ncbi:MAG: D-glycero-beta-D-manno-heptose 1-phosphate adenylyltransferase [Candidatus Omnitrophica bacterium]|nr:D-glycero-beta-D-manno-heptose 1-phosphate adenylyltransferase [Candidatus Omnitrophota bacterium]